MHPKLLVAISGIDWAKIDPPLGWTYTMPFHIIGSGSLFKPANDWDVSVLAPVGAGKAYYVDPVYGNDAWAGTAIAPFKTCHKAVLLADIDILYLKPGFYYRTNSWYDLATRSIATKPWSGYDGQVILTDFQDGLTWTAEGGTVATYKATRSNVGTVIDMTWLDADNDYRFLTNQVSIANVDANPGSWYTDGATVYVRTYDSRAPDTNICPEVGTCARGAGNITLYFENIWFYGTQTSSGGAVRLESNAAGQTPKLYMKNCVTKYAVGNGVTCLGVSEAILQNCYSSKNLQDGFNYHIQDGIIPNAIEINCRGFDNGTVEGSGNDNGSSIHDAGNIVRIMGQYYRNIGPNVIDIDGALSWNLRCAAYDSASDVPAVDEGFVSGGAGTGTKMWLDHCVALGNAIDLIPALGNNIYKRLCVYTTTGGSGTISDY